MDEAWQRREQFNLLREAHRVRDFQLVLFADACGSDVEVMRMLKEAVAAEKALGGFNDFFPEPMVTIIPRSFSYVKVGQ